MNAKTTERGYVHAKKEYEKTGTIPDMTDPKYDLCSEDFRKGVEMFEAELKNNLK
jgi:hypothetical protein